jgi:hypothetical protein
MPTSAYLYPWDVDGDPAAADRIAGLGVSEVSLAAAYHAVRAVTPFHPGHRVVTRDTAVYHRPDPERWRGARLRPVAPDPDQAGSFERAADALHRAGLTVNAWLVLAHNGRLGAAHPECAVHNAYGDPYPWALCIGSPEVGEYAATLSAEVAALGCVDGVELEACGWYGYDHGSAHDKTGGGAPGGVPGWLLDTCFCRACTDAFRKAGADPAGLTRAVCAALDAGYRQGHLIPDGGAAGAGAPVRAGSGAGEPGSGDTTPGAPVPGDTVPGHATLGDAVPEDLAELVAKVRAATAEDFLHRVLAAVRDAAPGKDVLVHSHPDSREAGSNPGFDPAVLLGHRGADGVILQCPGPAHRSAALVARTVQAAPAASRVAATLAAVTALGGRPAELPGVAAAVQAAGATDLRLYHAGLASAADLAALRDLMSAVR